MSESFSSTSASQNCLARSLAGPTGSPQHDTDTGKPVADEEKREFKIGLRVQGVPQTAVHHDADRTRRIKRLAHMLKNQSQEKALIRETCRRLIRSTHLAKSVRKSSTNCVTSSTLNYVKSLKKKPMLVLCQTLGRWSVEIVCHPQKRQGC